MSIQNIGFIGTGIMGSSMVRNLTKAGFHLTVYNRTRAKAEALLDEGAAWADASAENHGLKLEITEAVRDICQDLSDHGEAENGSQSLLKHYVGKQEKGRR